MEEKFNSAKQLFEAFEQYCQLNGIFIAVEPNGNVELFDFDLVATLAEQEFSEYDDPILALTEFAEGSKVLETLGSIQAGLVDMVM